MEEDLLALLLADTAVAALVEGRAAWGQRLQNDGLPALVLYLISQPIEYSLDGPSLPIESRVQIDCWGGSPASAKAAARAVAGLLSGWSGVHGATLFQGIFQENARDGHEDGEGEERIWRSSLDFMVNHQERN